MRRLLLAATFVLLSGLSACQCDDPPEVGPTERDTSLRVDLSGQA